MTHRGISLVQLLTVLCLRTKLPRLLQVIRAFSGTDAVHASDEQFLLDLDWKPKLSGTQEVITWAVPITVCCLVYFFTAPAGLSIPYGTCIGVLFGLLLVFVRSIFMEAMYKVCGDLGRRMAPLASSGNRSTVRKLRQ